MPTPDRVVAAALLLAVAACGGQESPAGSGSPLMRPGEDCLHCHEGFTAAGTIYASATAAADAGLAGARVTIDAQNASVTVTTNAAGNFYTAQSLVYPITGVLVSYGGSTSTMHGAIPARAGCATCHAAGAALGRIHVP